MKITLLDFIPLFGALLSMLFLVSIVLRLRKISTASFILVAFLFVCFLSLLLKFLDQTGYILQYIHLTRINYLLGILRPPLFFLYIYFAIHPRPKNTALHVLHFLPLLGLFLYLSPYLFLSAETKSKIFSGEMFYNPGRLPSWYGYAGLAYSICYLILSVHVFNLAQKKKGLLKPNTRRWILALLTTHVAFIVGAIVKATLGLGNEWDYLTFQILTFSIITGCVVLLANANNQLIEAPRSKYSGSNEFQTMVEKLVTLICGEKLYLNDALRIKDVAQRSGLQEYVVSQVINAEMGVSFIEFINQLRIEEAKRKLADPACSHLTIEAIGEDSGFNSKASFYAAFKKQMGLTPTEFKRKLSR